MNVLKPEKEQMIVEALLEGKTQKQITLELRVGTATIQKVKEKHNIPKRTKKYYIEKQHKAELSDEEFIREWAKATRPFKRIVWAKEEAEGVRMLRRNQ